MKFKTLISNFKIIEIKKSKISDIAYIPLDVLSHAYPFLDFLSECEARGLTFDVYGSKNILNNVIKDLDENHFEFEELDFIKEGIAGGFKSCYQGFLKTIPAIERIWKENQKKA